MSRGTRTGQGLVTQARPNTWSLPWGVIGKATSTSTQAMAAIADVTSLTTTFTASASRVYKIEWMFSSFTAGSTGTTSVTGTLVIDGSQVAANIATCGSTGITGTGTNTGVFYTTTLTAASHTIKMQVTSNNTGTMGGGATTPHVLIVTDVGPA